MNADSRESKDLPHQGKDKRPWRNPDPDLVRRGLDHADKGAADKLEAMESPEFPFEPHLLAYLKALSNIADLQDLPDSEEEVEEWEEKNPEKAARLFQAIDHLSSEFGVDVHPTISPTEEEE